MAVETGEADEEKVEEIVSERVIEKHEEAGEVIPWVAGALFLVSVAGLVKKSSNAIRLSLVILGFIAIIPLVSEGHTIAGNLSINMALPTHTCRKRSRQWTSQARSIMMTGIKM